VRLQSDIFDTRVNPCPVFVDTDTVLESAVWIVLPVGLALYFACARFHLVPT
jgi:hypothetical protein